MDRILQPRRLAACWRFRRALCAAAAGSRRPPPDESALPRTVRGILSNYCDLGEPHLFARPRSRGGLPVDATFGFMPFEFHSWDTVLDHCNGLVLYDHGDEGVDVYVCNPATRRWALLPRLDGDDTVTSFAGAYLAFDPSVSPHFEVFLIPRVPDDDDDDDASMDWPPAVCKLPVFSSRTGRWAERAFAGSPFCTVAEARSDSVLPVRYGPERRYAEYWRGALYVHCRGAFVMKSRRLSLSEDKYQAIKTPTDIEENRHTAPYLGRSKNGVYYAALRGHELRVWILDESGEQMDWVLKHLVDLKALYLRIWPYPQEIRRPWGIVDHYTYNDDKFKMEVVQENEWDSNDDDVIDFEKVNWDWTGGRARQCTFVGFHPFREVVFLSQGFRVIAYHLSSSKIQFLGSASPYGRAHYFENSFVYTPCLIDSLPKNSL
ncbi:hypothetical protein ACP70R_014473 [Stipagrostis hirtigluma subsp. patula]